MKFHFILSIFISILKLFSYVVLCFQFLDKTKNPSLQEKISAIHLIMLLKIIIIHITDSSTVEKLYIKWQQAPR